MLTFVLQKVRDLRKPTHHFCVDDDECKPPFNNSDKCRLLAYVKLREDTGIFFLTFDILYLLSTFLSFS